MSIAERLVTEPLAIPRPATTAPFARIDTFDKALSARGGFGPRLRVARTAAPDFRCGVRHSVGMAFSLIAQIFPSSELTGALLNPGTSPTFTHRAIRHG
ncbi:hypothetical protein [Nocardia sp. NPDC004860]|uniref:hypothetical protein n=1 Tax=Nocardia sp. NPDC004860 TaxID=3154557 RepID=UPI0033B980E3